MTAEMGGSLYELTAATEVTVTLRGGGDRRFRSVNVAIISGGYLRVWRDDDFDVVFNAGEWSEMST